MPPLDLVLSGRTVRLEPMNVGHAPDLEAEFRGRDELWDYMPSGPFADVAAFSDWIAARAGKPDPLFLTILDIATNRALGVASFMRIDAPNGVIEVGGIAFSPALQGSVMATEAMVLMMKWAFDAGYRRYEWKCNALNLPSRRAAQRLGFSYEGLFRQHMILKGRNRDTAWFSILDTEWLALKEVLGGWLSQDNFDSEGRQGVSLSMLTRPLIKAQDPALQ
jgi:RimJ/RimL family protein N-acetyltransferase